jgi:hypothetical protein
MAATFCHIHSNAYYILLTFINIGLSLTSTETFPPETDKVELTPSVSPGVILIKVAEVYKSDILYLNSDTYFLPSPLKF